MSYPSFSKSGMATLTFPRGPTYGDELIYTPRQRIGYSEAGLVRVAILGSPDQVLPLVFERLPQTTIDELIAWFQHALIQWAAYTFTYTDVASVTRVVRCIDTSFTRSQVASTLYNVNMTLRVEMS